MQQMQLGIFCAVVIAFIVCGWILTRRPTKRPPNKHKEWASGQRGEAAGVIAQSRLLRSSGKTPALCQIGKMMKRWVGITWPRQTRN
jgi:hypothetical protein